MPKKSKTRASGAGFDLGEFLSLLRKHKVSKFQNDAFAVEFVEACDCGGYNTSVVGFGVNQQEEEEEFDDGYQRGKK